MKRILIFAAALICLASVQVSAQVRWGVVGGVNFNTAKITDVDVKARAGWNVGATCLVDLPLGFSLQPSLVYSQKGANLNKHISQDMGYLELPVSVQWGPDLLLFRPFLDVTPYIGYAVSNRTSLSLPSAELDIEGSRWFGKERFEYGLGLGGGINVWKLQILARYCWNFGSLYNVNGWDDVKDHFSDLKTDNEHFGGVTVSLAFLF